VAPDRASSEPCPLGRSSPSLATRKDRQVSAITKSISSSPEARGGPHHLLFSMICVGRGSTPYGSCGFGGGARTAQQCPKNDLHATEATPKRLLKGTSLSQDANLLSFTLTTNLFVRLQPHRAGAQGQPR
jgi:hypothetical protein